MLVGFCRVLSADSPRIEGIEENPSIQAGKIRWNPATIALAKFFSSWTPVIAGSIGFQRVAVVAIGLVQKGAVDDWRFRIILIFFSHF